MHHTKVKCVGVVVVVLVVAAFTVAGMKEKGGRAGQRGFNYSREVVVK